MYCKKNKKCLFWWAKDGLDAGWSLGMITPIETIQFSSCSALARMSTHSIKRFYRTPGNFLKPFVILKDRSEIDTSFSGRSAAEVKKILASAELHLNIKVLNWVPTAGRIVFLRFLVRSLPLKLNAATMSAMWEKLVRVYLRAICVALV